MQERSDVRVARKLTAAAHELWRERNEEIIRLVDDEGETQTAVAKRFGMTRQRVSKIILRERRARERQQEQA